MDQKGPAIGRTNFKGCKGKPRGQSVGIGEGKVELIHWYGQRFLRWTVDITAAVTSLERKI